MPKAFLQALLWPAAYVALHGVLSLGFSAYARWPGLDVPMHFGGGVVIVLGAAVVLRRLHREGQLVFGSRLTFAGAGLGVAALAAVVWEFTEWTTDRLLGTGAQVSLDDTMLDLLMGLLGAATAAALVRPPHRHADSSTPDTGSADSRERNT